MPNARTKADLLRLEATAQRVAGLIGPVFDRFGAGFALLGFEFGEDGWATWVSNAQREDMIIHLRKMADVLERGEDMPAQRPGDPEA